MVSYSRRRFLGLGAGAAAAVLIQRSPFAEIARAQTTPLVRRNLNGLSTDHEIIRSFELAITRMKELPVTDPRSWDYQAAIHGTRLTPKRAGWDSCVHGSDLFWPWHRMYLYYFERIVREMSGNPAWALPFWDWSTQRKLPAVFRVETSSLYVRERAPAMNSGAGELRQSEVDVGLFLDEEDYPEAGNTLETGQHSAVHVRVGGETGWMRNSRTAAQDPIFWVHHANVDRLWNRWLAEHDRLNLAASKASLNKEFIFFDERGRRVTLSACDLIRATAQLGYQYEGQPQRAKQGCRPENPDVPARETLLRSPKPFVVGRKRSSSPLPIEPTEDKLRDASAGKRKMLLRLDNVAAERQPGTVWQVFLGLPRGEPADPRSPHFIGNLALFGSGVRDASNHHFQPAQFTFPVDRAISAALRRTGKTIPLTFVPTGLVVNGKRSSPRVAATVSVGSARLLVEKRS
jgi:tyrosinase